MDTTYKKCESKTQLKKKCISQITSPIKCKNKRTISSISISKNSSSTLNTSKKVTSSFKDSDLMNIKQTNESYFTKNTRNIEKYFLRTNSRIRSIDNVHSYLSMSFLKDDIYKPIETCDNLFEKRCKKWIIFSRKNSNCSKQYKGKLYRKD